MRRPLVAAPVALLLLVATAVPALAAPLHLHCLENASGGVVSIGRGVTAQAPHASAFDNLHNNLHVSLFIEGDHPLDLAVVGSAGSCPTSIP